MSTIGGFFMRNTSFEACEQMIERNETFETTGSDPIDINDTTFRNIHSETNGAAIYHSAGCPLTVLRCIFENCSSDDHGGGIRVISQALNYSITIKFSIGINCSALARGGFFSGDYQSGAVIERCEFIDCFSSTGGGGLYLNRFPKDILVSECNFSTCHDIEVSEKLSGGGITIGDSSNFTIRDCSFIQCSAAYGGGINFQGDGTYGGEWTASVMFCFFEANEGRCGAKDISFRGNWITYCSMNMLKECRTLSQGINLVMNDTVDVSGWIPSRYFNPLYVNVDLGIDHRGCGMNERKCKSISFVPSLVEEGGNEITQIVIESVRLTENGCNIGEKKINVSKKPTEDVIISSSVQLNALFHLTTGVLGMNSFTLIHNSTSSSPGTSLFLVSSTGTLLISKCNITCESLPTTNAAFIEPVIVARSGFIELSETSIAEFLLSNAGVIYFASSASVKLMSTNICNVTSENYNGAALNGVVGNGKYLILNGSVLRNISTDGGNGGGMSVSMEMNSSLQIHGVDKESEIFSCRAVALPEQESFGGGIYLKSEAESIELEITYLKCSANEASVGKNAYVFLNDLRTKVNEVKFAFMCNLDDAERDGGVIGKDLRKFSSDVNLFIFIDGYVSNVIELDRSDGEDEKYCGKEVACKSVDYGVGKLNGSDDRRLQLVGSSVVNNIFELLNTVVKGMNEKKILVVNDSLGVNVEAGTFSMESCNLGSFSFSSSPFLFSSPIKLLFSNFYASAIQLKYSPLFLFNQPIDSAEKTQRNVITTSLIIEHSTFLQLEASGMNDACVISTKAVVEAVIEGCTFCDVSNENSAFGGAIFIDIAESGSLTVNGTTATERCACEKLSVGRGGFMHICHNRAVSASNDQMLLKDLSFDGNDAFCGKDLFILCTSLLEIVDKTKFAFAFAIGEQKRNNSLFGKDAIRFEDEVDLFSLITGYTSSDIYVDGNSGLDHVGCGGKQMSCRSFDVGLSHLAGNEQKNITLLTNSKLNAEVDVDNVNISSKGDLVFIELSDELAKTRDCVILSKLVIFFCVTFSLPDPSSNTHSVLFQSNGIGTSITLNQCSFTNSTQESISQSLVWLCDGCFFLKKCTLKEFKFSVAPFVICNTVNSNPYANIVEITNDDSNSILVEIDESVVGFVEGKGSSPTVISSADLSNDVMLNIKNSSFIDCHADSNDCGGTVLFSLNCNDVFSMNDSNITKCSALQGKGGGVFLDCKCDADVTLPFVFGNVSFTENSAIVGRDVFVRCESINTQINESQFIIDFNEMKFNRNNSIWGTDNKRPGQDVDLIPIVIVYRSEMIFVKGGDVNAEDKNPCGSISSPCSTVNFGLSHILPSSYSRLMICKEAAITSEGMVHNVTIQSFDASESTFILFKDIIEANMATNYLLLCWDKSAVDSLIFEIRETFECTCESIIKQKNGTLRLSSCEMRSVSQKTINSSMILVQSGVIEMYRISINNLILSEEMLVFQQGTSSNLNNVSFSSVKCSSVIVGSKAGLVFNQINANEVNTKKDFISIETDVQKTSFSNVTFNNINVSEGHFIKVKSEKTESDITEDCSEIEIINTNFKQIQIFEANSIILMSSVRSVKRTASFCFLRMRDCIFRRCLSPKEQGKIINANGNWNVSVEICDIDAFEGENANEIVYKNDRLITEKNNFDQLKPKRQKLANEAEEICKWNKSSIEFTDCSVSMKDTAITNSSKGGLTISGGKASIEKGEFENNNPHFERYPSVRRNIYCYNSAQLNVISLKGGDGLRNNTSLWILNDGCELSGIASERKSANFIPTLNSVEVEEHGINIKLNFKGSLLLPCNLSFQISSIADDVEMIEKFGFTSDGFVSESEVWAIIDLAFVESLPKESEISASILFVDGNATLSTSPFVLRNKTVTNDKPNEDEHFSQNVNNTNSWSGLLIIIILAVLLFIILIISIIVTIRWRKQKRRTKELEVIVEDTVRKDPKAFEMVTMEMSPEEQWRRAEREAEKKNEERIKKRMNGKEMEHSESSEYLLAESDSTEYILGRDSDKIPQWMLEKVDEKEEDDASRKRTPSPSISSTSTTDTSDTDSTFVRGEDLCPTTSSMSNLVDAMACSSPHEKLIVDLRDSLFMLLHGMNEKKEMAIGTLQEREQTAAQILFWVANGALHSFDEMENELSSLQSLSPHIVLFSEHMVICIVMHSDFSSDSDSSSISSTSTIVTSSSDFSSAKRNGKNSPPPSSAFEDDEDNRKECMRWKAPELLINKNMGATKESVSFSIGTMLWECLTLHIPFGDYEAEMAGQKIVNGERMDTRSIEQSSLIGVVKKCVSSQTRDRLSLMELKREFIQHFPAGAVMLTITDAVTYRDDSEYEDGNNEDSGTVEESGMN
eukprot:MONOS_7154.1-p1 / transcript=MONOS_7154.1 / gene=MONOS_7154 / organism=Monocercomonoides_exilis_PA203 / gene_product=unspecified product / transcript_product=unspecified product / location=Mono_scaffold00238:24919-32187(+) / protein_length=2353 / sequence_SO=supercontig / SO=protein_coding / is_pseudo=false